MLEKKDVDRVDILLATFNGENYLEDQLLSLFNQTHQNFHLLIRDDGSTDQTLKILKKFQTLYPDKITFFEKEKNPSHIGSTSNFSLLLGESTAPYLFFCDQDDIWLKDKVEASLKKMKEMEEIYGKETPLLVHTDLEVVDASLNRIDSSFWHFAFLKPEKGNLLPHLLIRNVVTGCTTLINSPLKNLSFPIPIEAIQHDWWIAILANLFGKIDFLPYSTILYRQHTKNALGAKKFSWSRLWKKWKDIVKTQGLTAFSPGKPLNSLEKQKEIQVKAILKKYENLLTDAQKQKLLDFIKMQKNPLLSTFISIKTRYL